ncbi:MAG: ABC transporter substrate-binding protein, partial [Dehalococcoidia bacterium]
ALTQANKAIYDDGINFISSASADESVAVNELCNEEKVIHVACSPGLGDALSSDFPYTFQTWPEDIEAQSVALEACKDQYPAYTTVAVIAPDNLRGQEAVAHIEEIAPTYGFNMTHSTYVALDEVDFYPVLTPIIDADVDVLLNPGLGYAEGGQMVKQARELGHNKSIVYTDTMDYDVVVDITGEDALEGIIVTPQQAEMFTEAGQAWAEKYIEKYGSLQYWASYRYDELSLFKLAIEEADSFDPDDILAVIGNVSYEGISGETRFATNVYSPDLPRYMKMQIPAVMIQDGEMVDIYQGYSFIWD